MGPEALALVLTAAVLHALWNYAAKGVTEDRLLFIWTYAVLSAALCLPVGVVWVVVADERPSLVWVGAAALSAAMHIAYQLTLQRGYAEGDLNLVYPLARGTGPLLTFVVAVTVLGERPGRRRRGRASLLVVAGVLLISWSPRATHGNPWPGVVWGVADGRDHRGVHGLGQPRRHRPRRAAGAVLRAQHRPAGAGPDADGATPDPAGRAAPGPAWRARPCVVAVLSPVAYVLVLVAMQQAPVALVAAARESSIVVGALLGWLALGEARGAHRLAGSVVVAAGIAAIVVG